MTELNDDEMSESQLWAMDTWMNMNGLDVPVSSVLLYKFCLGDWDKCEELMNIVSMAFEAGKASK